MEMRIAIQAESKLSQIRQSPAKAEQRKSKKKALISFDFLVRIEPFQRVMLTPWAKEFFYVFLLSVALGAGRSGRASSVNHARLASKPRLAASSGNQSRLAQILKIGKKNRAGEGVLS
jgi:hypothetical protein